MTHRETELLPWYLNATLDEHERRSLESHLEACSECARALEELRILQAAERDLGDQAPAPPPFLLTRALAEVDEHEKKKHRSHGLLWLAPVPRLARFALLAEFLIIVALAAALVTSQRQPGLETLSGPSGGGPAAGSATRIAIAFQNGVLEEDVRRLFTEIGARIVDGPSSLGIYTVELSIPQDRIEEMDRLLEKLRQNARIVRIAERKL